MSTIAAQRARFPHRHLLGIKGLTEQDITLLLDRADEAVKISRQREKKTSTVKEMERRSYGNFRGARAHLVLVGASGGSCSSQRGGTRRSAGSCLAAEYPDPHRTSAGLIRPAAQTLSAHDCQPVRADIRVPTPCSGVGALAVIGRVLATIATLAATFSHD